MSASAAIRGEDGPLSGTVVRVLSPGGAGRPWRGIVQPEGTVRAVFLTMDVAPAALKAGDDVHVPEAERFASGDSLFPDEVRVRTDSARARIAAVSVPPALIGMEPSASQKAPESAAGLAGRLGMGALAGLAAEGLVRLDAAPGVFAVARARESADPVIAWAMQRFSDPETDWRRGSVALIVDPAAMLPRRTAVRGLAMVQRAAESLRSVYPANPRVGELMPDDGSERLADAMPALMSPAARKQSGSWAANASPGNFIGAVDGALRMPDLVIPYNPAQTGCEEARGLACTGDGYAPRTVVPPRARAMITVAHEMGHGYQGSFGYRLGTLAEAHAGECFADAVGIITYVAETGDVRSARAWAGMRAVAGLGGSSTHATGPACLAAIEAAADLRASHGPGRIPLSGILLAANRVARATAHPRPEEISGLRKRILTEHPDFNSYSPARMAEIIDRSLAHPGKDSFFTDRTAAYFRTALAALPHVMFTPYEMRRPANAIAALKVERADLSRTVAGLRGAGLGGLVPSVLRAAAERAFSEFGGTNGAAEDRAAAVLSRFAPRLTAATSGRPAPGWMAAVRHGALRLAGGVAQAALATAIYATGASTAADFRRIWSAHRAALDHIAVGGGRAPQVQREMITALPGNERVARNTAFDLPLSERMRRLGEMAHQELGLISAAGKATSPAELVGTAENIRKLRERMRPLAWAIRVESGTWADLSRKWTGHQVAMISRMAENRPTTADSVWMQASGLPQMRAGFETFRRMAQQISAGEDLRLHGRFLEGKADGKPLDWSGRDLRWMDLRQVGGRDLQGANLSGADLRGTDLFPMDLSGVRMEGARLEGAVGMPKLRSATAQASPGMTRTSAPGGARRLHCEDGFAMVAPDGTGVAFINGEPAVVVEFTDPEGHERTTRLMPAREADPAAVQQTYGPDARAVRPEERHFAAIRLANQAGDPSESLALDPVAAPQPAPKMP